MNPDIVLAWQDPPPSGPYPSMDAALDAHRKWLRDRDDMRREKRVLVNFGVDWERARVRAEQDSDELQRTAAARDDYQRKAIAATNARDEARAEVRRLQLALDLSSRVRLSAIEAANEAVAEVARLQAALEQPDRELAVTVHETVAVAGWPPGTQRTEGDFYAAVYNAPCMHHELVRGLDHERRNGWRLIGQCDIDGVGDCLVFWRI